MPSHIRRVRRIAETGSPPRLRGGYGYGDPTAQHAELIDMMVRPAMRRAATMAARFPSRAALARAEPESLNASDGTLLLLAGDILASQKVG